MARIYFHLGGTFSNATLFWDPMDPNDHQILGGSPMEPEPFVVRSLAELFLSILFFFGYSVNISFYFVREGKIIIACGIPSRIVLNIIRCYR